MRSGGRIGNPTPYGEVMAAQLREYLGREGLEEAARLREELDEEQARKRRWT